MSEVKTPVYLENVIYFFEKADSYYRKKFIAKSNNSQSSAVDTATFNEMLLQLKNVLANASNNNCNCQSADSTKINELIDDYFNEKYAAEFGSDSASDGQSTEGSNSQGTNNSGSQNTGDDSNIIDDLINYFNNKEEGN